MLMSGRTCTRSRASVMSRDEGIRGTGGYVEQMLMIYRCMQFWMRSFWLEKLRRRVNRWY